ncbi:MAG: NAD(P)H-hydrate dehydratase [Candidatus Woesearchaeota archaeon]
MQKVKKSDCIILSRSIASHKGQNGNVLVVGGSEDYTGAVYLASVAALRTGADIVTACCPEQVGHSINSLSPDIIAIKMHGKNLGAEHFARIMKLSKEVDVILIGNGIGVRSGTARLIRKIVSSCKHSLKVVDADALKVLKLDEIDNAILTPNKRELYFLANNSGMRELKMELVQKRLGTNVIIIKGPVDIIMSSKKRFHNTTGSPGMTVAGTGDVLAGLCAGILSQSGDLLKSAVTAAYLNGKIGERLTKEKGYGFLASDFIPLIPKFFRWQVKG